MDGLARADALPASRLFAGRVLRWSQRYLLLVAMIVGTGSPLWADSFTVANTNGSGSGSLRQADIDANAAAAGAHSIDITATDTIAVGGSTNMALPLIQADVSINGPGVGSLTVSGDTQHWAFFIDSGNVNVNNLTIDSGNVPGGQRSQDGRRWRTV